jgi:hypothetical protein
MVFASIFSVISSWFSSPAPSLKNNAGRPDNTRPTHKSDSLHYATGNACGCHVTSFDEMKRKTGVLYAKYGKSRLGCL